MPLPVRAVVEATPGFLTHLQDARAFLAVQDEATAAQRFRGLRAELREMVEILAWAPGTGRPARFLSSRSAQGRLRAQRVRALAAQTGLPQLREYVLGRYVVLYAHSETRVALLALRHQRQLDYTTDASGA